MVGNIGDGGSRGKSGKVGTVGVPGKGGIFGKLVGILGKDDVRRRRALNPAAWAPLPENHKARRKKMKRDLQEEEEEGGEAMESVS